MSDDVIVAKSEIIERCIGRAREELAASKDFAHDFTRQDAAILNIERACEGAVDIANRIIRLRALGPADSLRGAFSKLQNAGIITESLSLRLQNMVVFRNIAVHQYKRLDLKIVESVIEHALDDLLEFRALALTLPAQETGEN